MKKYALPILLASTLLLTSCNQYEPCTTPARLYMPVTLKEKLKAMDKTPEDEKYLRDLRDQQLVLEFNRE